MLTVLDLESPPSSPSSPPRSSKKRFHDGIVKGGQTISELGSEPENKIDSSEKSSTEPSEENSESESNSEDVVDREFIKRSLLDFLENITFRSTGTFATNKVLSNATNPGLYVKDLGGIGLPLSEHDAHRLIAIFDQTEPPTNNENGQKKKDVGGQDTEKRTFG